MNIALIAHDSKKELMAQFCTAYSEIFKKHNVCATETTGKMVEAATGLKLMRLLSGSQGGSEQIASRIQCNEIDILIFFRDPLIPKANEPNDMTIFRLCDVHQVPYATNIATAEVLIMALERGDLDWRNYVRGSSVI